MRARFYPDLDAAAAHRREEAFRRFHEWEARQRPALTPEQALAAVGGLYLLIPPAARQRPIDTEGVARLHRALAVLK